ncbi:MAG: outer membrane beta-barrel protein [Reyranella sp.]|nr:outer membrane beta-barrel protein [Reyranella sp.]
MTIRASRVQLIWSPVVGWVLMSCAASVAHAQVDTPSPARQTLDQQTPQLDLPDASTSVPAAGSRNDGANELGISVGAFTLYPELTLLTGYDDNVFATPAPTVGSSFVVVRPQLELRSEWIRHQVRLLASGGFGFYPAASTQNYQNYLLQVDGRLDIRYDMYATGLVAFRRSTEALGTPNVSFAQAPTVADSMPVELGFNHRFSRLFYELAASATKYWYYDYSTITSLGLPAASRNLTEYEERFRVGYEVSDNLSFFIAPSMNQRVYVETINIAGQQRDSQGWTVNAGATWTPGPKSKLEGAIGTTSQNYTTAGTTTSAFIFSLVGSWNGYEPLTLRPAINRTINESALSNYQNYVSTVVGVDFIYDIHYPWKAVGGLSYNQAAYTPAPGVAGVSPRTDTFIKASIGLLYEVRPQYSIGPVYEYSQGTSTDVAGGGPQFTRNLFSIRLVAKR